MLFRSPMGKPEKLKVPSPLVAAVTTRPVAEFVIVTAALGTAPPVASETLPCKRAVSVWAQTMIAESSRSTDTLDSGLNIPFMGIS